MFFARHALNCKGCGLSEAVQSLKHDHCTSHHQNAWQMENPLWLGLQVDRLSLSAKVMAFLL